MTTDAELLPAVVYFVRQVAHRIGLSNKAAEHLDESVEALCRNVIEQAFGPDEEGQYDILVLHRPGQVVIAVEDQGLPFDYARSRDGRDITLPDMLHRSFADEVRLINLGRGGNRVELVKHLPHADVREQFSEDEHHQTIRAAAAAEDTPLEIRIMRPEESFELSRCMYRSYGYSYLWDFVYYPERVHALQESGLMRSCVAVTQGNEFVGHLAVRLEHPDSCVGEAGQAVVDPRFRGHRLFERMMTFMAEHAKDWGLYGLYGEAIAVHPYSEKGFLHLGAKETGFLLGYVPASVSFKGIDEKREGRRGSVALFYMRIKEEPERVIYPPHPTESSSSASSHTMGCFAPSVTNERIQRVCRGSVSRYTGTTIRLSCESRSRGATCTIRYGLGSGSFVCIVWTASTRTCRSLIQPRRAPGPGYTS
jgi:serine/threonine-protein kinase RsbW